MRLAVAILLIACALTAQNTATQQSYQRARAILDQALAAHGGAERLRTIRTAAVKLEGELIHRHQSRRPDPPYDRTANTTHLQIDYAGRRLFFDDAGSWPGGFQWRNGLLVRDGQEGFAIDLLRRRANRMSNPAWANQSGIFRRLPHTYLLEALDAAASLRYLPASPLAGRAHQTISYAGPDRTVMTLFLDAATHRLSRVETMAVDPLTGDSTLTIDFTDYAQRGGLLVPARRIARRAGEVVQEHRLEASFDVPLAGSAFQLPSDVTVAGTPPPPPEPWRALGDHVFLMQTSAGYGSLVVEFPDHLLVLEAPANDRVSERTLADLKQRFSKPVRYLAASHHHDDHAGGVRGFLAAGVTLLAPAGQEKFYRQMAQRQSTLAGDKPIAAPRIERLAGARRVFESGGVKIELINIGPGPHAEDMLIAWLPDQRIVFQGDLWNRPADGAVLPANPTTVHFLERLKALQLQPETIAGVHGPTGTWEQLEDAVRAASRPSGAR
jgi:glyoxylase-like metal-dependent hydrolase (beta-lactamase superfamily II)